MYGSVARGDFNLHSDIDLLVVADLPEHPLEQSGVLYRYVRGREEPKGLRAETFGKLMAAGTEQKKRASSRAVSEPPSIPNADY